MKLFSCAALLGASLVAMSTSSYAGSKPWPHISWGSGYEKSQNYDFVPYRDNGKKTHLQQWEHGTPWRPETWAAQHEGKEKQLLERFYVADILRERYEDGDVHVLVVGPNFYRLSSRDQSRIVEYADYIYKMSGDSHGFFYLEDWNSEARLGTYTAGYGLQYQ